MFGLGVKELIIILGIALIIFGAKRLPDLAKAIGSSIPSFKKGLKETDEDIKKTDKDIKETEETSKL